MKLVFVILTKTLLEYFIILLESTLTRRRSNPASSLMQLGCKSLNRCAVYRQMTGLHCCAFTQSTTRSTACHRGSFHFLSDLQGSVCVFGNFEIRDLYYSSLLMCTVCLYILFSFCCMILINRSQNTFRRDKLFSERLGITIFECVKIHSVSPLYFNFTVLY